MTSNVASGYWICVMSMRTSACGSSRSAVRYPAPTRARSRDSKQGSGATCSMRRWGCVYRLVFFSKNSASNRCRSNAPHCGHIASARRGLPNGANRRDDCSHTGHQRPVPRKRTRYTALRAARASGLSRTMAVPGLEADLGADEERLSVILPLDVIAMVRRALVEPEHGVVDVEYLRLDLHVGSRVVHDGAVKLPVLVKIGVAAGRRRAVSVVLNHATVERPSQARRDRPFV